MLVTVSPIGENGDVEFNVVANEGYKLTCPLDDLKPYPAESSSVPYRLLWLPLPRAWLRAPSPGSLGRQGKTRRPQRFQRAWFDSGRPVKNPVSGATASRFCSGQGPSCEGLLRAPPFFHVVMHHMLLTHNFEGFLVLW
jgi:hypothetical protein